MIISFVSWSNNMNWKMSGRNSLSIRLDVLVLHTHRHDDSLVIRMSPEVDRVELVMTAPRVESDRRCMILPEDVSHTQMQLRDSAYTNELHSTTRIVKS